MKTFLKVVVAIVLVLAVLWFATPVVLSLHRTTYVVTVMDETEDRVYVHNGAEPWMVENVDRWFIDKNSRELSEILKPGYSFVIEVVGYRIPAIGAYENVVYVDGIGG